MNDSMFAALVLLLVGAAGFCFGHTLATGPLQKLIRHQKESEMSIAHFCAMMTADVARLKSRVDDLEGNGEKKTEDAA